jgi:hypothetical protein
MQHRITLKCHLWSWVNSQEASVAYLGIMHRIIHEQEVHHNSSVNMKNKADSL